MSAPAAYRTPYATAPGSSTPPPEVQPAEGTRDLWGFFWLSIANTAIITVAGLVTWWFVH